MRQLCLETRHPRLHQASFTRRTLDGAPRSFGGSVRATRDALEIEPLDAASVEGDGLGSFMTGASA